LPADIALEAAVKTAKATATRFDHRFRLNSLNSDTNDADVTWFISADPFPKRAIAWQWEVLSHIDRALRIMDAEVLYSGGHVLRQLQDPHALYRRCKLHDLNQAVTPSLIIRILGVTLGRQR
jgi:hypothetical protein